MPELPALERTLDNKGRLAIPRAYAPALGECVLLMPLPSRLIGLLPLTSWAEVANQGGTEAYALSVDPVNRRIAPPSRLRRYAGWLPGQEVAFIPVGGGLVLSLASTATQAAAIAAWEGKASA